MRRDFLIRTACLAGCFDGLSVPTRQILEAFGSLDNLYSLDQDEALHLYPPLIQFAGKLFSPIRMEAAERDIEWAEKHNLKIMTIEDAGYPERLRQCPDAPLMLYMRGECDFSQPRFIAIVGTRAATGYGRRYCDKIVEGLSRCGTKPVVVSGLALGIDTYAHTFALRYGLDTVAVMGTGFDTIYPPSNYQLADEILRHGALVTEFSPFVPSYPVNFVRRNRIIAGLCDCTLVVESKAKGGGLITARLAQDYDRSVFAVPGRFDDNTFRGCNDLIEDHVAAIVTGADSIIRAMDWDVRQGCLPLDYGDGIKGRIVKFLADHPESDAETVAAALGCTIRDLSLPLVELEMSGAISLVGAGKYCAN